MSLQLTLYPQNYQGYTSSMTNPSGMSEYVVGGISFINYGSWFGATSNTFPYDTALAVSLEAMVLQDAATGGMVVNTWYGFKSDTAWGYPQATSGKLTLYADSQPGGDPALGGVFQKLSNLTIGAVYDVLVDNEALTGNSKIQVIIRNSSLGFVKMATFTTSPITFDFIAQSTNDIISVTYVSTDHFSARISEISVTQSILPPSGIYTDLKDGQVICDLYEEEDIPLTLSIDDFKNVTEKVQSYSKDFSLPATKRNNQIFNNMFEITRADDRLIFNPYVKTKCVLKQDGFVLFEGYLRMIDIKDKEGEISYNVNLYSEVIALADILKTRTFSRLSFSELTHDYNRTQIQQSWYGGLTYTYNAAASLSGFRDDSTLRYPYIDWNHELIVDQNGNPELTALETAFRPCIQIRYLINRIFESAGFTWTSNFFETTDFGKLYMDFNWGSALAPNSNMGQGTGENINAAINDATLAFTQLLIDTENWSNADELGYDSSNTSFTANRDNQLYHFDSHFVLDYWNADISVSPYGTIGQMGWRRYNAAGVASGYIPGNAYLGNINDAGSILYHKTFSVILNSGESLRAEFKKDYATVNIRQVTSSSMAYPPFQNFTTVTTGTPDITTEVLLENLRGKLNQWDFIKGIITMFNLITLKDETNLTNILIEPYSDIFVNNTNSTTSTTPNNNSLAARSIQHDWTDKVDVSQMELKPLTNLNKTTDFKFVEDADDYAFNVFKNATSGHLYGSLTHNAAELTILEGKEEIIAKPFAATVSKPLMSQFPEFIVPVIYSQGSDDTWEGFDNSPRIFYNNGVKDLVSCTYYIPEQNGVVSTNQDKFLQFSHLSDIPTIVTNPPASTDTIDFVFSSHQLASGVGDPPVDNLYSMYWQPYFNELYNADTRIMTLKVNLTPSDIATFKFFDMVIIKNRAFRVNKIEYKPNSLAKVEFILL